jgi:hypothetical protein
MSLRAIPGSAVRQKITKQILKTLQAVKATSTVKTFIR